LNVRSELLNTCRHRRKFKLSWLRRWPRSSLAFVRRGGAVHTGYGLYRPGCQKSYIRKRATTGSWLKIRLAMKRRFNSWWVH